MNRFYSAKRVRPNLPRETLDADVKAFLANGGRIKKLRGVQCEPTRRVGMPRGQGFD
jgi:hypothetical protein